MSYYLDRINKLKIVLPEYIDKDSIKEIKTDSQKKRLAYMLEYQYGSRVLEVGSGQGILSLVLCKEKPEIESYTAVEKNKSLLEQSIKLNKDNGINKINFVHGDGCNMTEFKDQTFDTVILAEVLEHIHNPIDMLNESYRVLKVNGNIIITVPSKGIMPPSKLSYHLQDFTVEEMKKLIYKSGFTLLHHAQHISWEFYLALKR